MTDFSGMSSRMRFAAEFHVSLATLRRFFVALVDFATTANDRWLRVTTRAELLVAVAGHGIAIDDADRLITRFSLGPRDEYLKAAGFAPYDVYPWRVNKQLSHRRRPLALRVSVDGSEEVLYAARHVMATWRDLIDQFVTGTFPALTRDMEMAKGKITQVRGAGFNAMVAELIASVPGSIVRSGVKKIGTATGTLYVPGDFDVLAAMPGKRRVLAIECKDIAPALDVFTRAAELKDLIEGDPARNKKSFAAKQHERVEWLKRHLDAVRGFLGVSPRGRWSVEGAIVTSSVVPAAFLRKSPVPIVSAEELRSLISEAGPSLSFRGGARGNRP